VLLTVEIELPRGGIKFSRIPKGEFTLLAPELLYPSIIFPEDNFKMLISDPHAIAFRVRIRTVIRVRSSTERTEKGESADSFE
jgi:hypothetical protein